MRIFYITTSTAQQHSSTTITDTVLSGTAQNNTYEVREHSCYKHYKHHEWQHAIVTITLFILYILPYLSGLIEVQFLNTLSLIYDISIGRFSI